MAEWMAAAGLVAFAAITPGPNNLIVMRAAARSGPRGAAPAIAGVVLGGLALLAVVALGGGALFQSVPAARTAVAVAGCLYLSWSGASLVAATFRRSPPPAELDEPGLTVRATALFAFQFVNPKSWVMALTATSAVEAGGAAATLARLVPLFVVIPTVCLIVWSSFGSLLAGALRRPNVRSWSDRTMGGLLFLSALLLLLER
jgi:threonine/homoserine/homoserine lactone efflux protein